MAPGVGLAGSDVGGDIRGGSEVGWLRPSAALHQLRNSAEVRRGQGLGRRLCIRRDRAPDGDEAPGEQAVFRFLLALVSRSAATVAADAAAG